jgi:ribonuclease R
MAKRKPSQGTPDKASKKLSKQQLADQEAWQAAGLHCSACERRADEASRDVEQWLKCKYVKEFLGEEFTGVVSTVTSFGLFVTLDQMFVEGLIHITELGGEYYRFDEARQELRGERTGIRYAAGTHVSVQVAGVDLDARKIDFKLLKDELLVDSKRGEPRPDKQELGKFTHQPEAIGHGGKAKKAKGESKASGKPKFARASPVTTRPKSSKSRHK